MLIDIIKEYIPSIIVCLVYTLYQAVYLGAKYAEQKAKTEGRFKEHETKSSAKFKEFLLKIEALEKDHVQHKDHTGRNDNELWKKVESIQNKIDVLQNNIQTTFVQISNSLGQIQGELKSFGSKKK